MVMRRRVGRDDVEVVRTDQRGVYAGAMQAYVNDPSRQKYTATVSAVTDVRLLGHPERGLRGSRAHLVPDGDPPAGGAVHGHAQLSGAGRPASAAARPRPDLSRPDSRAQQPGRRGGARHRGAQGPGGSHAPQAGDARAQRDRPAAAGNAVRGPGRGRARDRVRANADCGRGVGARGRSDRLARHPRRAGWLGARASFRRCRHDAGVSRQAGRGRTTGRARQCRALARLHAGDRAADGRDHRLGHPHLEAPRRRQAVLPDGPRALRAQPTSTSASRARCR